MKPTRRAIATRAPSGRRRREDAAGWMVDAVGAAAIMVPLGVTHSVARGLRRRQAADGLSCARIGSCDQQPTDVPGSTHIPTQTLGGSRAPALARSSRTPG